MPSDAIFSVAAKAGTNVKLMIHDVASGNYGARVCLAEFAVIWAFDTNIVYYEVEHPVFFIDIILVIDVFQS